MSLSLFILALAGLFSLWSLNRSYAAQQAHTTQLIQAVDEGRLAQVHFKIQVQEWKDILLRGASPAEYAKHVDAFDEEQKEVQGHLVHLRAMTERLKFLEIEQRVAEISAEHRVVTRAYVDSLEGARRSRIWAPAELDRSLKGIDRMLNLKLDHVGDELLHGADQAQQAEQAAQTQRYETLRKFITGVILASIVMIVVSLAKAMPRKGKST